MLANWWKIHNVSQLVENIFGVWLPFHHFFDQVHMFYSVHQLSNICPAHDKHRSFKDGVTLHGVEVGVCPIIDFAENYAAAKLI